MNHSNLSNDEYFKFVWKQHIRIKQTDKFYGFKAYSGYALQFEDPEADEILLDLEVSDEMLGQTVLDTLKQSRYLSRNDAWILQQEAQKKYQEWVQNMMKRYGYKGKRALFKNMKSCGVNLKNNLITIKPSKHDRLEGWSGDGFTEEDYVKIAADSPPAEIGVALRLAFTRCK